MITHKMVGFLLAFPSLLLLMLLLGTVRSKPGDAEYKQEDIFYTKTGALEVNFNLTDGKTVGDGFGMFQPQLFFQDEKENRKVFNMDVCVDLLDTEGGTKNKLKGIVIICYPGQLNDSEVATRNVSVLGRGVVGLDQIKNVCNNNTVVNGNMENRTAIHGLMIEFDPPIYNFFSYVDQMLYTVNASEFEEDEVRVLRFNNLPKYCFRLEMGRMPPDPLDVQEQQSQIQDTLREILFDSGAKNSSDNFTSLLEGKDLALEVEDVTLELVLKTIELSDHRDAYLYGSQQYRVSKRVLGLFANKSEEKITPKENRTRELFVSERFYRDFMPKVKTDKNYLTPNVVNLTKFSIHVGGIKHLNFSFNNGNIFPCRAEWVDLQKFQMERDFYHSTIHEFFSPIHIAYTVGLVGYKNESEQGFGPGQKKKGKLGPGEDEIKRLREVLRNTEGATTVREYRKENNTLSKLEEKFCKIEELPVEVFTQLNDYYTLLDLDYQKPLSEVTVKQLVYTCGDNTFNLPYVASFVEGVGL